MPSESIPIHIVRINTGDGEMHVWDIGTPFSKLREIHDGYLDAEPVNVPEGCEQAVVALQVFTEVIEVENLLNEGADASGRLARKSITLLRKSG
jgi:hypothetical protein